MGHTARPIGTVLGLITLAASITSAGQAGNSPQAIEEANKTGNAPALRKLLEETPAAPRSASESDRRARALVQSLKSFKSDEETVTRVIGALGELRSKRGTSALGRLAFRKKPRDPKQLRIQVAAINAIALSVDTRLLTRFESLMKNRDVDLAKAAYGAVARYEVARAPVRKKLTAVLMKRLELEYPAYSNSNGKYISAEKRQRWRAVSPRIIRSLQAVAKQPTISQVEEWREWWRAAKRNRWTDLDRAGHRQ